MPPFSMCIPVHILSIDEPDPQFVPIKTASFRSAEKYTRFLQKSVIFLNTIPFLP